MAAVKTVQAVTQYTLADANAQPVKVQQHPTQVSAGTVTVHAAGAVLTLSKQSAADLITALTNFSNTGVLT